MSLPTKITPQFYDSGVPFTYTCPWAVPSYFLHIIYQFYTVAMLVLLPCHPLSSRSPRWKAECDISLTDYESGVCLSLSFSLGGPHMTADKNHACSRENRESASVPSASFPAMHLSLKCSLRVSASVISSESAPKHRKQVQLPWERGKSKFTIRNHEEDARPNIPWDFTMSHIAEVWIQQVKSTRRTQVSSDIDCKVGKKNVSGTMQFFWKQLAESTKLAWCFVGNEQFGESWHLLRLMSSFSSCEETLGRWIHKILLLCASLLLVLFMFRVCFMGCWERLRSKLMWFIHDTCSKKKSSKDRKSYMKKIRPHISFPVLYAELGPQKEGFWWEAWYWALLSPTSTLGNMHPI